MNIQLIMQERRRQQYKAGIDAAEAMYAAGTVPLDIMQRACEARSMSLSYSEGMRDTAQEMEQRELGGVG